MDFARAKKPEVKPAPRTDRAPRAQPEVGATDTGVPRYLRGLQGATTPAPAGPSAPEAATDEKAPDVLPLYLRGAMGPGAVPPVQAKLAVAPAKSTLEEQADQVARTASAPPSSAQPSTAPPRASATPNRLTGTSGEPLSSRVRERVEPVLGRDLADVRVHQASDDRDAAESIRARAFTHKEHVFLGRGESPEDVELLAHEMTHVVQQTEGDAPTVQRKPADYRQPGDGAGPAARMQARIDEELGDEDVPSERPDIDRGDVSSKGRVLQPQARPDVDRAAQERPGVQAAAGEAEQTVDAPAQAEGEGKDGKREGGEAGGGEAAVGDAEQSAAQDAFATAAAAPQVTVPDAVSPVPQVTPVDAGGKPLTPVDNVDAAITEIAEATQGMRDEGTSLQEVASTERANARILEGNLNLVRKGVAQSDLGVATSQGHAAYRRGVLEQGRTALGVSRQKTAWVAEQAPQHQGKADAGREDSEGMAQESSELSAESEANTPDDSEAAEKSGEQRGEIDRAGGDVNNLDRAFSGSQERARGLSADAAQATGLNTQAEAKLTESTSVLQRTDEKLGQMREQTDGARAQVEALASRPAEMVAQADETEAEGRSVVETSVAVEERLRAEQDTHRENAAAIPEETPLERAMREAEGIEAPRVVTAPPASPVPATAEEGEAPPGAGGGRAAAGAREPAQGEEAQGGEAQAAARQAQDTAAQGGALQPVAPQPPGGEGAETVVQRQPQAGYEDRWDVDPAGAIAGHIPQVLGGSAPGEGEQREGHEEHEAREQERHRTEVLEIQEMAGKPFEQTTSWERRRIALRMAGRHLWSGLSGIRWPGWGTLALGLVNPVTPLLGVVSGFGMIASGAANLVNIQAWKRDPIGNLLKTAADIATGLTIILGSITALAAVIAALCTALILVSFGFLGPALGPVVAFCGSVMVTTGGWTIAVGKWALLLQFLCFLKNLYEAGVARNATELQQSSDRISSDVSAAGNVVLQMGMAKLAQVGGRGMQRSILRAGGGARWGGGLTTRFGTAIRSAGRSIGRGGNFARMGAAIRRGLPQVPGVMGRGVRSIGAGIRNMPAQAVAAARALPGVIRSPLQSMRGAFGWGMSRGYLLGRGVAPGLAGLRAAGAEGALLARLEAGGVSASAAQHALRVWEREGLEMLLAEGLSATEIQLLSRVSEDALRRLLFRYSARELVDTAAHVGPRGIEVLARLDEAVTRPQLVWAMQLPATEAEALLRQLSVAARTAILDISATEARDVIATIGIGRVNTALGQGSAGAMRGSHLRALLQRVPVRMAEDLLDSAGASTGRLARLARVADGLEPAEALLPGAPVTADTTILDSNARIAIDSLLTRLNSKTGTPILRFADLDANYRDAINALRTSRGLGPYVDPPGGAAPTLEYIVGPAADLRLSPLAGAEAVGGQTLSGRPSPSLSSIQGITPDRANPRYLAALEDLITAKIGKGKGGVDRAIIADALFADTTPGAMPTIISVDEDLAVPLARQFGVSPRTFSPRSGAEFADQLVQRYPEGYFVIQVQGRSLKVVFGPPTGRPPVPAN
ncbi:DUF4157 domain-containing protein [Myxococcus sp. K15C18031901]|uniref:eCIS core domain-containing protein n=1 Tax=Myxococcus dinghuensis TaxID=2906761 RepID=UPI0020A80D21|nr:DUF4157 domain-containing protein [Myxococcus dinghuensis]MCP3103046.1 DUF4157 domain-containing protein [Myxococcus dinghuensis]